MPILTALREAARPEAFVRYALLDTPPEPEFEQLTALVAKLFDVPIALVSLVDRGRQWFKSNHGLAVCESPATVLFLLDRHGPAFLQRRRRGRAQPDGERGHGRHEARLTEERPRKEIAVHKQTAQSLRIVEGRYLELPATEAGASLVVEPTLPASSTPLMGDPTVLCIEDNLSNFTWPSECWRRSDPTSVYLEPCKGNLGWTWRESSGQI